MSRYRRHRVEGGCYFFTVNLTCALACWLRRSTGCAGRIRPIGRGGELGELGESGGGCELRGERL